MSRMVCTSQQSACKRCHSARQQERVKSARIKRALNMRMRLGETVGEPSFDQAELLDEEGFMD